MSWLGERTKNNVRLKKHHQWCFYLDMMTRFLSMSSHFKKQLSSFYLAGTVLRHRWIPRLRNKMLIWRNTFLLAWDCFLLCYTEIIENIWIISFLLISNQYSIEQLPDLISRYISLANIRHPTSRGKDMECHKTNIFFCHQDHRALLSSLYLPGISQGPWRWWIPFLKSVAWLQWL